MSERTAVYRLFSADDTLLYVGVAKRFGTRWDQHARVQSWWPHVEHQTVRWYPSREDALLAEKLAMKTEQPVYNIKGSPWIGGIKDDGTGFYVLPKPPRPKAQRRCGSRPNPAGAELPKGIQPGIRLPEPLYDYIKTVAQRERRSLNAQINLMLEKAADKAEADILNGGNHA